MCPIYHGRHSAKTAATEQNGTELGTHSAWKTALPAAMKDVKYPCIIMIAHGHEAQGAVTKQAVGLCYIEAQPKNWQGRSEKPPLYVWHGVKLQPRNHEGRWARLLLSRVRSSGTDSRRRICINHQSKLTSHSLYSKHAGSRVDSRSKNGKPRTKRGRETGRRSTMRCARRTKTGCTNK